MKFYKSVDELPGILNINDISVFLQISKAYAYQLVNKKGFPTLRIGTRIVVPKDLFLEWLKLNTNSD